MSRDGSQCRPRHSPAAYQRLSCDLSGVVTRQIGSSSQHYPPRVARRVSEAQKQVAAVQAARRMIARRATWIPAQRGRGWHLDGHRAIRCQGRDRRQPSGGSQAARSALAAVLEVDPATFDLEAQIEAGGTLS